MDLLQELDLRELRQRLDRLRLEKDTAERDLGKRVAELTAENLELRLRLGALVRLLIARGHITAEEYAALLSEANSGAAGRP